MYSKFLKHQIKVQQQKTKTIQKREKFVKHFTWTWTGTVRRSGSAAASPQWCLPINTVDFWSLLNQRPGFIVVSTLMGFVLFHLSHVLWPSIALAWLPLQERRRQVINCWSQTCTDNVENNRYRLWQLVLRLKYQLHRFFNLYYFGQ